MNGKTRAITESAIMIALAAVLSTIKIGQLPSGGSITAASMVPIIIIALRAKPSWAILTSVTYACVQMLLGFYPPPVQTIGWFIAVVLLDYVLAFGVLGCAGIIAKPFKNRRVGAVVATAVVMVGRFACHYVSGLIVWGSGDPNVPAWLWSLTYNGSYMGVELVISVVVIALLWRVIDTNLPQKA